MIQQSPDNGNFAPAPERKSFVSQRPVQASVLDGNH